MSSLAWTILKLLLFSFELQLKILLEIFVDVLGRLLKYTKVVMDNEFTLASRNMADNSWKANHHKGSLMIS